MQDARSPDKAVIRFFSRRFRVSKIRGLLIRGPFLHSLLPERKQRVFL
jgi:hypothetical protein